MFADDTKAYMSFVMESECQNLQEDVNNMTEWTNKWNLTFNESKCKVMHLGVKNPNPKYYMQDLSGTKTEIASTKEEKDLGVYLDPALNFRSHIAQITKKANSITGLIIRNFKHLDTQSFVLLYKSLVRPTLEYAAPVWTPYMACDSNRLEAVKRRATRAVKTLRKKSYSERLRLIGLPTLSYRRKRADIIQVYKIFNSAENITVTDNRLRLLNKRTYIQAYKLRANTQNVQIPSVTM